MCIIVYKPAGTPMPTADRLRTCFMSNPDGAGFMYPIAGKGKVRVRKGYMTFADLMTALDATKGLRDVPVVLHFRIGTQGKNDAGNCHPFPVSTDDATLVARDSIADVAIAHNGIIPLTSSYSYTSSKTKETRSDTFYFVRDFATCIIKGTGYHADPDTLVLLERLASSKLCIMGADSEVRMVGTFTHDDDGCFYSNSSYEFSAHGFGYSYKSYGTATTSASERYFFGLDVDDLDDFDERIDETKEYRRISATFVPEKYSILDETSGRMVDVTSDAFVFDRMGRVYLYDDESDGIVYVEDFTVVDDEFNYVVADRDECVAFSIL